MIKTIYSIFLFSSSFLSAQSWLQITDFPGSARDDGSVFSIGNKAYCFTGSNGSSCTADGYIYDGVNNVWTNMATLPNGKERQYATAFSYSNTGYMLTGITCNNICLKDFWMYSPTTNSWSALPDFPGQARQGACNFVIGDKAYIISGRDTSGTVFTDVWEFNFTNSTWTQKNNLPFAGMFRGTAFQINNIGYVCFGLTNNSNFNSHIYQYDQLNDSWLVISSISLPARNYVACAVTSNKAFFYGGQDSTYTILNDVHLFDPLTNTITTYLGIPTLGRKGGMAFSLNNIFYITTGVDSSPARVKETWKNDQFVSLKENNPSSLELNVFPNPTSNEIKVQSSYKIEKAIILDVLGKRILEDTSSSISVKELPNGIYNLVIYFENSIVNKKIIIQHE